MNLTGAKMIVRALSELGVARVFGIPGSQNVELYDELRDADFPVSLCTHELCGAFMADAVGRVTGRPGVLTTVPGPGMTNALTGIAEALLDHSPMVAIVPDCRNDSDKTCQLHEIAQAPVARPLAKAVIEVRHQDEIPEAMFRAFEIALSDAPGPVVVNVPFNLLMNVGTWQSRAISPTKPRAADADIEQAAKTLLAARRIGLYVGAGTHDATKELRELATLLRAPVATTISGRGAIAEDDDLSVGFGWGVQGTPMAREIFKEVDCVLAIACTFGEVPTASYCMAAPAQLIHVDVNAAVLGRNMKATQTVHSDAGFFIRKLVERLKGAPRPEDPALKARIRESKAAFWRALTSQPDDAEGVSPGKLLMAIRAAAPRDAIITTDSGHHMFWVTPCFEIFEPRTLLTPADYQSMGFGVPAMVAAKQVLPERTVIGIVGDGGFLMTGMELVTAARYGLGVKCVVFNDGKLDLISKQQKFGYKRDALVKLHNPDFEHFARAVGLDYVVIRRDDEIGQGVERMFASDAPMLIDAHIHYREVCQFMHGVAKANVKRAPLLQKWRFGKRLLARTLFKPGESERE